MSAVGQREKRTRRHVVKLFLNERYDNALITRALHLFERAAGDTSKSVYDRNREVHRLLRHTIK